MASSEVLWHGSAITRSALDTKYIEVNKANEPTEQPRPHWGNKRGHCMSFGRTARPSHFMPRFIVYTSFKGKGKGKAHPITGHEGPEVE